jgi:hypothetical protein
MCASDALLPVSSVNKAVRHASRGASVLPLVGIDAGELPKYYDILQVNFSTNHGMELLKEKLWWLSEVTISP